MIVENIFDEQNLDLFIPNDGVEFIYSILQNLGYRDFTTKKARKHGLDVLNKLFELDLIEIFSWGKHHDLLNNLNLTKNQTIKLIDNIWFVGADFEDFLNMPMFRHKDWYLKALDNEGLTSTTNWKTFVNEKIGDLEQWIEKNRPKE
ncbi:hypothetical protein J0X14_17880 [Muricauda sp. CAU 1633]|uniref:hypothetical protein n=1 Tax=Allomuricauda sp. CAU 1633 TaxID=2816036 RepID=UPI001A8E92FA|nr:hypothetical protein [Muricauda sp. CAU 1633]MBO0324184.1 hypothetical protein [Muricauda sp. CAU 1633]